MVSPSLTESSLFPGSAKNSYKTCAYKNKQDTCVHYKYTTDIVVTSLKYT